MRAPFDASEMLDEMGAGSLIDLGETIGLGSGAVGDDPAVVTGTRSAGRDGPSGGRTAWQREIHSPKSATF